MPVSKPVVNGEALSLAAKTYDPILRTLPFFAIAEMAKALGLNVVQVENEDVILNRRRLAGATGPYQKGMTITYKEEVARFFESSLKPELVVSKTKDNITNYKDKQVLVKAGTPLDLKAKVHPLEQMIVEDEIKSHAEDVIFSAFFAERNVEVFSPATAFTGFYPVIDALIAAGYISTGDGNLKATGALSKPSGGTITTDTSAYDNLVEFIGGAHNLLRSSIGGKPQLLITDNALMAVREAFRNKVRSHNYPTMAEVIMQLRDDAMAPELVVNSHVALGTGSRLILQKLGNMDFGMNTNVSNQFCQVRNIFEDPNEVQFWIEAAYGTRVRDIHAKVFRTNEQTNTGLDLAGDYVIEAES